MLFGLNGFLNADATMSCPICKNQDSRLIHGSFFPKFHQCEVCTGYFIYEQPPPVYSEEYFRLKNQNSFLGLLTKLISAFFLRLRVHKVKTLLKDNTNEVILDYGCGPGYFIKYAAKKGFSNIAGFEPSRAALGLAEQNSLPVYDKLREVPGGYDLMTFWGSLEHTDNPSEVMENCRDYLKNGGRVLIALQNADSWEAALAKEKWFHYDYPFHRIQFTPKALAIILHQSGFSVKSVDFFYPEYALSGLAQTFLNLLLPKNVFYTLVSNRRAEINNSKAILIGFVSLAALFLFSPFLIMFFLAAVIFKKTGAMVFVAEKV